MDDIRQIERKVFEFIEKYRLLRPGDRVVVGVSGGADSVCLLFVLSEWAAKYGLELYVVHVNHGIRKEAGEDAAFVRRLCEKRNLPFALVEADVPGRAARERVSVEEMGRTVRYEAFEAEARRVAADHVAVAHNANDQAETMLFHLFRGSGLTGLGGIRPLRGKLIRPILCLEREEIERYLREKGVEYCQDSTNEEDHYARNRIRHHLLPYAEEQISKGSVAHMSQTALMLQEVEEYLLRQVREAREKAVREDTGEDVPCIRIDCQAFHALDPVIGKRLLLQLLQEISPTGKDLARIHVEEVFTLFRKEGGAFSLPCGVEARRQYGTVILERAHERSMERAMPVFSPVKLDAAGLTEEETRIPLGNGYALSFKAFSCQASHKKSENIPRNQCTKWFDCDKMNKPLIIRTRRTGDYLEIRQNGGKRIHQTIKQYMINEKIPREERDRILLLAEESHVLWVLGCRISEHYKVDQDTKRILQVQLKENERESMC